MRFAETALRGVFIIDPERHEDARGFFARTWCATEAAAYGLNVRVAQCNVSYNARRGTLRGLHYQAAPHEEAKLVRCSAGAIFDVTVDLRAHSPSFGRWIGVELTATNGRQVYIPEGCAHGFQTLTDATEVVYQMSVPYCADAARGVRWDDPMLDIRWPVPDPILSDRDRDFELMSEMHLSQRP